jgi:hypothetical protein
MLNFELVAAVGLSVPHGHTSQAFHEMFGTIFFR